jgi:hypothetical protein
VVLSSIKFEYIEMAKGVKEILWMTIFLPELGMFHHAF